VRIRVANLSRHSFRRLSDYFEAAHDGPL
jgi:hypothetical protein